MAKKTINQIAKQTIQSNNIQRKEFNYEKNGVKLNFTLRTDVKGELNIFKELMLRGVEDINTELKKIDIK